MEMVNSRELSPSIRMVFCPFGGQWGSRGLFIARISARILMENYIRMRTPAEGFIGSHPNFPRWLCPLTWSFPMVFPMVSPQKKAAAPQQASFKRNCRLLKFSRTFPGREDDSHQMNHWVNKTIFCLKQKELISSKPSRNIQNTKIFI